MNFSRNCSNNSIKDSGIFKRNILEPKDVNEDRYENGFHSIILKIDGLSGTSREISDFLATESVENLENVVFGTLIEIANCMM